MTASRALNELYRAKLLTYDIGGKTGRSKEYRRIADPDYFEKGSQLVKSPIKKVVYVKLEPENSVVAGLEALAELTMINPPDYKIRAIYGEHLKREDLEIIFNDDIIKDKKLVELQIWEYDPKLFSNKYTIDVMSLYASLKDESDERVEQALQQALRGEKWYTD